MNTIILKNQLDFQQYQLAVKALADMGIEVAEPEDSFEITEEDIRRACTRRYQTRESVQ